MDASTAIDLSTVVTQSMMSGVLTQVVNLLPVVLPTMIGFVAIRKGISFVMSMLHSA